MSTLSARTLIVGEIEGEVNRKSINGKALAEFHVAGLGLRIVAWESIAAQVPQSGSVIVEGQLRTRSYQVNENGTMKDRSTTEVIASSIFAASTPASSDEGF